ncbi:MAG: helix-turn-helix transcriptional regulator [Imperialibacter sp.]|uniref:helix-turn-helix transcriptional regulator n=1 Tax=Imperialibacter sp. TaxID=2038411 RepID=UPI0032EDBBC9
MSDKPKTTAFERLLSNEPESNWREEVAQRRRDKAWLSLSADIALRVLEVLDEKNMSQAALAREMAVSPQQVSKIVKGGENLTLETICKLEEALNIKLVASLSGDEIIVENNVESLKVTLAKVMLKQTVKVKMSEGFKATIEEKVVAEKAFQFKPGGYTSVPPAIQAGAGESDYPAAA